MLPQNSTNRFGDVLYDLLAPLNADGTKLQEAQRIFNEFAGREEVYKSWLRPGSVAPLFQDMRAKKGSFEIVPLEYLYVSRNATQSIPDNTETPIVINGTSNTSNIFTAYTTQVNIGVDRARGFGFIGATQWANNANGRRGVHVNFYDESGVQQYGLTLHSLKPTGVDVDTLPYARAFNLYDYQNTVSLKFTVIQTSGGALDLQYFSAGIFLLY